MRRAWRVTAVVVAVATAQTGAVLVYRWVEHARKERTTSPPFQHEQLLARPAPEVTLTGADGSRRHLSDFRGRPVLLHFWATWCPPCKAELPALLALGRELDREQGVRVVALATDADWNSIRSFFGGLVPDEVALDETGNAAGTFEVSVLPDTYLVDADGWFIQRFGGARDWSSEAARALLRTLGQRPLP
jgi:thiol-disulfide isomerase/thioredoxin